MISGLSRCHQVLDNIYSSKGERRKTIHYLEVALDIASSSDRLVPPLLVRHFLAQLFADEYGFDDAHTHIERATLYTLNSNDTHLLVHAMWLQAGFWYRRHRFEEARSEPLGALEVFEKLGAAVGVEGVREFLREIDQDAFETDDDSELLETMLLVVLIDSLCSDRVTESE